MPQKNDRLLTELHEPRFAAIFRSSPVGICITTLHEGTFLDANPAFLRTENLKLEEILGRTSLEFGYWRDPQEREKAVQQLAETGALINCEMSHRQADGSINYSLRSLQRIMLDGQDCILTMLTDITDRTQSELALRQSHERLLLVAKATNDAVWDWNLETDVGWWNEGVYDLLGYQRDLVPIEAISWQAHLHPADRDRVLQGIQAVIDGEGQLWQDEYRVVRADGSMAVVFDRGVVLRDATGKAYRMIGATQNITERKRIDEALRESEGRLRLLVKSSNIGLWDWNLLTNEAFLSPEWKQQLGYADHEITNHYREWESRLHPEDHDRALAAVNDYREGRRPDYNIEFRLRHKDGSWRWIMTRADLIHDHDGQPIRMLGCHVDITERKQAEAALREGELRMRVVTDTARVGLVMVNRERRYIFANATYSEILKLPAGDLMGRLVADVLAGVYERQIRPRLDRAFAGERVTYELQLPTAEGSRCFAVSYEPCKVGDAVSHVVVVIVDITDRTRAEGELRASRERLASLSRQLIEAQESERRHLSRELHDEIGQALTGIKLNLKAMQQRIQEPGLKPLVQETLSVAEQTLQQVRSLALDLRPSMLDELGLVAAVRWCFDRQAQRAGFTPQFFAEAPDCILSKEIETTCYRVAQESLTNIVRHANADNVRVELRQHGTILELLVQDDGVGFDVVAARDRAATGASLGLLGMQERVQLTGGQLEIESISAGGTLVRARFPIQDMSNRQ